MRISAPDSLCARLPAGRYFPTFKIYIMSITQNPSVIAAQIRNEWPKIQGLSAHYLTYMEHMYSIHDRYKGMSAPDVILNFLVAASAWRGDRASKIKTQLFVMICRTFLDSYQDLRN